MQLTTLNQLLVDEIQELYIAEQLIEDGLGRMVRGAAAEDLKKAFEHHAEESKEHTKRLETICEILEVSPRGGRGYSVKALLREAEDRMGDGGDPHVVDASLIAAGRRVEHWEIASYGVAQVFASALHRTEVADLLGKTLAEEQATDERLAAISQEVHVVEAPAHN